MLLSTLGILLLLVGGGLVFVNTSSQFGQNPKGADLERMKKSPLHNGTQFVNPQKIEMDMIKGIMSLPRFLSLKNGSPDKALPVKFGDDKRPAVDSACFVTWYGHSAFLIEMNGKRILIDPMLGDVASPLPFGSSRYTYERPIPLDEITDIDMMIISHDHYDHLDYPSIKKLKDRVAHFFTPLGVGSHLRSWGVDSSQITEFDWWDESKYEGIRLVACPARHFSGRGIGDNNKTLWASWIIESEHSKLYFSGDGGYGPHFKEIGEREGPFDLAMMECGQYDSAWAQIHMMPEESVQGGLDVKAKILMPIHWGAFQLGIHTWTDPIERFTAKSEELNAQSVHPIIGERFLVGMDLPKSTWWE